MNQFGLTVSEYGQVIRMVKRASSLAVASAPKGTSPKASAILVYTDDPTIAAMLSREQDLRHFARVSQIEGICFARDGQFPEGTHEAERPSPDAPRIAALWFPAQGDECPRCQLFHRELTDGLCARCDRVIAALANPPAPR